VVPSDNLFFTVLGFRSAESKDANAEGQRIFDIYRRVEKNLVIDNDVRYDFYKATGTNELTFVGDESLLCTHGVLSANEVYRCITDVPEKGDRWRTILANNQALQDRYARLVATDPHYLNPFSSYASWPLPPWAGVMGAKRAQTTSWALLVDRGDVDSVIAQLNADARFWRKVLAQRNLLLVDKMFAVAAVRGDLWFASELMRTKPLSQNQYSALRSLLKPFDAGEMSLTGVMENELRMSAAFLSAAANARPAPDSSIIDKIRWMQFHLLYQPNATLNFRYQYYERLGEISQKPCTAFASSVDAFQQELKPALLSYAYNPIGKVMDTAAPLPYQNYIGRLCDLEGMQRLIALQLEIRSAGLMPDQIPSYLQKAGPAHSDPYTGDPMQWDAAKRTLSFRATDERVRDVLPWPI
jgi:hypothetical protein